MLSIAHLPEEDVRDIGAKAHLDELRIEDAM